MARKPHGGTPGKELGRTNHILPAMLIGDFLLDGEFCLNSRDAGDIATWRYLRTVDDVRGHEMTQ